MPQRQVPSQDMVLGIYYLTQERPGNKGEGKFFKSVNEAILAYENQVITLQSKILVRCSKVMPDGSTFTGNVQSTLGQVVGEQEQVRGPLEILVDPDFGVCRHLRTELDTCWLKMCIRDRVLTGCRTSG